MMHYYHRMTYMGERIKYALRRQQAQEMPSLYCSMISDGMAQNHCELPWYGNQKSADRKLPQHLQGVLNHGRNFTVYRTFHNVRGGGNLSVHCLLSSIEKMRNDPSQGGAIPDTLYLQIDGGAENTAKTMLGMCELLVARRIVKKIVLTRLPTGHSHEDIDAVFANIWTYIRSQSILSPQQYKLFILQALKKRDISIHVDDVFAIPDYTAYLEPYVDPELSR